MVLITHVQGKIEMTFGKKGSTIRALSAEEIDKLVEKKAYIPVGVQEPGRDGSRRLIKGANDRQPMIRGCMAPPTIRR